MRIRDIAKTEKTKRVVSIIGLVMGAALAIVFLAKGIERVLRFCKSKRKCKSRK